MFWNGHNAIIRFFASLIQGKQQLVLSFHNNVQMLLLSTYTTVYDGIYGIYHGYGAEVKVKVKVNKGWLVNIFIHKTCR